MSLNNATDSQVRDVVSTSFSLASALRKLGMTLSGGSYKSLKRRIQDLGLSTDHMTGQLWSKGAVASEDSRIRAKWTPETVFLETSTAPKSVVRKMLLREGRGDHCEKCGVREWGGEPLTFELDHINGIRFDHRRENLRFLCPNCHSQTPTYRKGGNYAREDLVTKEFLLEEIPKFESVRELVRYHNLSSSPGVYRKIREVVIDEKMEWKPPILTKPSKTQLSPCARKRKNSRPSNRPTATLSSKSCLDCSTPISPNAVRCKSCAVKHHRPNKIDWPSTPELLQRIEASNYSAVARELGVSDNAVRKRIRNHPE